MGMWVPMGIGLGVFLIAVGASLVFDGVRIAGGLNLLAVGWILLATGLTVLIASCYRRNRRRVRPALAVWPPAIVEVPDFEETTIALPLPMASPTVTATAPVVSSSLGHPGS